jgi:hypothetical protein
MFYSLVRTTLLPPKKLSVWLCFLNFFQITAKYIFTAIPPVLFRRTLIRTPLINRNMYVLAMLILLLYLCTIVIHWLYENKDICKNKYYRLHINPLGCFWSSKYSSDYWDFGLSHLRTIGPSESFEVVYEVKTIGPTPLNCVLPRWRKMILSIWCFFQSWLLFSIYICHVAFIISYIWMMI